MLARKIALCEMLHKIYDSMECRKCKFFTSKEEACLQAECFAKELAFRQKYMMENCDYYLPGSFIAGSDYKAAGHEMEIRQKYAALAKCASKCCE